MKKKGRRRTIEIIEKAWKGRTKEIKRGIGITKEVRARVKTAWIRKEKERERGWSKAISYWIYQVITNSFSSKTNSCHPINYNNW